MKEESMPDQFEIVEVEIGKEKYKSSIQIRNHSLIADEPVNDGGQNLGPNPYDYLLASLGACTAMTLRMYGDLKKWPLDGVKVYLKHNKIYAEDCRDCETEKGKIDEIERSIELLGDLTVEQKERLLQIANKCPVHKTLNSEIKIRSSIKNN